jgi:hypothetical protein
MNSRGGSFDPRVPGLIKKIDDILDNLAGNIDQTQIINLQNDLNTLRNNLTLNTDNDIDQSLSIQQIRDQIDVIEQQLTDLTNINSTQDITDQDIKNSLIALQGYFSSNKLKLSNLQNNGNVLSFLITDTDSNIKWTQTIPTSFIVANANLNMGPNFQVLSTKVPDSTNSLTNKTYVDGVIKTQSDRIDAILADFPITVTYNDYDDSNQTWSVITKVLSNISSLYTFATATLPTALRVGNLFMDYLRGTRTITGVRDFSRLIEELDDTIANRVDDAANIATNSTELTALQTRVTQVEGTNTTQTADITALQTRATQIEGVNTTQTADITSLQTRATQIETVNTTQTSNITALTTRMTTNENLDLTQNGRLSALEANIGALNVGEIADQLDEVRGAVSSLNDVLGGAGIIASGGIGALFGWLFSSNSGLGNVKSRISDVEDKNSSQDTAINNLATSVGTNSTNITNVSSRVTILEGKNYVPTFTTGTTVDQYKVLQLFNDTTVTPNVVKSKFDLITDNNISNVAYSKITGTPTNYWPTGSLVADSNGIIQLGNPATMKYGFSNIREPTALDHVATKNYVDTKVPSSIPISSLSASTITNSTYFGPMGNTTGRFLWTLGSSSRAVGTDTMYGFLNGDAYIAVNGRIGGLNAPNLDSEVANKWYVDNAISAIGGGSIAVNNILPTTILNNTTASPTFGNDTNRFLMRLGSQAAARVTAGQALVPAGKTSYAYGDAAIAVNGHLNRINYPNGNSDCANKVYVDDMDYLVYDQVFREIGHCCSAPGYDGKSTVTPLFFQNLIVWLNTYDTTYLQFTTPVQTANVNGNRVLAWIDGSPLKSGAWINSNTNSRPWIFGTGTTAYCQFENGASTYLGNSNFNVQRGLTTTRISGFTCFIVVRFRDLTRNQAIISMDSGYAYSLVIDERVGSTGNGVFCPSLFAGGNIKFKNSAGNAWQPNLNQWYCIMFCYSPQQLYAGDQQMLCEAWCDQVNCIPAGTVCTGMSNGAPFCTIGALNMNDTTKISCFTGDIKEILMYSNGGTFYGRPSQGQRESIFNQLKYKHGLATVTTL